MSSARAKHLLLASLGVIFFSAGYAAGGEPGVRVTGEHHIQIEPKEYLYIQVGEETITCQDPDLFPPQLSRQKTCFSP
jgi:hypothetical protein